MKTWIITWDAGFGESADTFEANTHDEAVEEAYRRWREETETQAEYGASEWTQELAEDYRLD